MKRIILTIDSQSYLVPEDQGRDVTGLLERISGWESVKCSYNKEWSVQADPTPEIKIAIVDSSKIDGLQSVPGAPAKETAEAF